MATPEDEHIPNPSSLDAESSAADGSAQDDTGRQAQSEDGSSFDDSEPIPEWLIQFAKAPQPEFTATDSRVEIDVPSSVFSDQERATSAIDYSPPIVEALVSSVETPSLSPFSIWENEDSIEVGSKDPSQILMNPLDELKIRMDDDPIETVAYIRLHMHDRVFREGAISSLIAYLNLEPENNLLKQVLDELHQQNSDQEI